MAQIRKTPSDQLPPHKSLSDYYPTQVERKVFLQKHFDQTAPNYNWISQMLSFGSGKRYRKKALQRAGLSEGMKILDVACGPGTVTRCALEMVGTSGFVLGLDSSKGMLEEARRNMSANWVQAYSEQLPFQEETFDFISMGYALRHVSDLRVAFAEKFRVLKPGGTILVMEISRPRHPIQFQLTRFYMKIVVPWITKISTRNYSAYKLMKYFWETIEHCVPPESIVAAIQGTGFVETGITEIHGGLIRDYIGKKPLEKL